jgi:hypothetical protein
MGKSFFFVLYVLLPGWALWDEHGLHGSISFPRPRGART